MVLLLVLGVLLVVADRVGVRVAEKAVAQQIASRGGLQGTPQVQIAGFPFLTQAVAGKYQDVRVHLTADQLDQPAGTAADVSLRGVQVALPDVLSRSVHEVPVDRVDGTATLPYSLLADRIGGDTRVTPEGSGVRVTRSVSVLGQEVPVSAAGTVSLSGGDVVIDVQQAEAAGVDVPGPVLRRAAALLGTRYPVPALPFGLQLTGVTPSPDGVRVAVQGQGTVLRG